MTRKLTMPAAMVLALGFMTGPAHGQQYGPPASGNTSALQFVPATLNLVAGLNSAGYGGDGGPANSATTQFNYPIGIAYDTNGNLFIADGQNEIVRRIDHTTGYISTFAGTPQTFGTSTTYTGPASTATFGYLSGLVIDSSNNVYVADRSNNVVWKITAAGAVSPYAGGGTTPSTCTGSTDSIGDGCQALQATISNVWGLGIDASNNIYIADSYDDLVREVNATTGVITVFAGDPADASIGYGACSSQGLWVTGTSAPYTASEMHMCFPAAVAFDSNGDAFIADEKGYVIREVTKGGVASIFAGNGAGTCTNAVDSIGDGCPATDAKLDHPSAIYVDASSRVYLADGGGSYVRMVDSTGNITMAMGTTLGELSKGSIGEPDTEPLPYGYGYTGAGDGIDGITMDPLGNIVASDSSGAAVTSAGSTGQYVFPETEILTTSTTTSAHATSQYYPPYILISNPSGVTLTLTGTPTVTGPFAVVTGVGAGTCTFPGSVAAGQTCTIVLSFTPTAGGSPGTAFNGTVSFDTNASAAPAVINLVGDGIGTATTSATLTVPGNTNLLTFTSPANVQSATQLVTLKNTGQTAIAISSYDFNGYSPTDFSVTGTTCPVAGGSGTLSAGDTCTYSIAFTPTSATTFEAGFQVCISTASYGCIQSVNLQGTGTGVVTLTPSPLAFNPEQVGNTSGPMVATLTNGNEPALTGTTITIVGANPTDFAIVNGANSCGTTVDGDGGTCSIYVTFSPASPTSFMATLQVAGMASGAPVTVSVPLTGSGLASTFGDTLSLSSLNFYGQIVGTTSGTITEQISNPAVGQSGAINFSAITATAPFAIGTGANACSTTAALEPDTVCNVYVTFTPGAAQAYTGNLTLTSNAVGSPQMVPLSGQGVIFNEPENQTQAMQTMNVYFSAYGETVDIYLLTQGGTYEEFYPDSTAGSCHRGTSYNIGDSCTVNVDFSPFAPGAVSGAIVITDPNGNILAEQDLPGMGTGPLVAFEPGVQSTVPAPATESGYQAPLGVAVDVNGDVFVADSVNNRVVEVQGGTTPVVLPATTPTLNSPFGVAVDGIGDVFAADTLNGRIVEWPWNAETQAYGTPVYIEGGLSEPAGVATDGYGNLYVADEGHNEVFAFPVQVGGTYGTAVALPFTGLHFPKGVFVDGNNNVFVADTGDGNIDELPWTGSGYGTQTTVVSNLIQPIAIAVDASGSIYTGNAYVGGVYQVPFNGTTYGAMNRLPITGLMSSIAVAVDLYGDVFVCDGLNNDVQELNVENEPVLNFATTSVGKTSTDSPKSATLTNIGNQALALDGSDGPNPVYPTDFPENTKATTLCASGTNVNPGSSCVVSANFTPLSPGNLSEGVVINDNNYGQAGNEDYITVNGTATGTANTAPTLSPAALDFGGVQIFTTSFPLEETVTNNTGSAITLPTISISQTGTNVFFLGTGTNQCTNGETLAVSASCNIYVTFSPTVSGQAYTGTLNVGSTSLTVALSGFGVYFNADVGNSVPGQEVSVLITKAGTPGTISVLTTGIAGLDFTNVGGGSCATGTAYTVGAVCSVDVGFAPQYSGARNGAVTLTDGSGNVLGITYVQGTGNGPQMVFSPATQSSVLPAMTYKAIGVATDAMGDLFVVDNAGGTVVKLPKSSTGFGAPVTIASGLNEPLGVAVDGAGNVYVADYANLRIVKIPWTGSAYGTLTAVPLNASTREPRYLQVDGSGNIFFTDYAQDVVMEVPWTSSGYGTPVVLPFTNQNSVNGIAVDENGDVFVGDTYGHNVLELPRTGAGYGTQVTLVSGLESGAGAPFALALDAADNLYVGEQYTGFTGTTELLEVPNAGNGAYGTPVVVPVSNLASIWGVALDASGNIYVADELADQVYKLDEADPPSLTFATTGVGSTSSDSPKVVGVTNIGNENLYFNNLQYPTDFPEGTAGTAECNTEFPVVPDGSCTLTIDFTPTVSGPLSEFVDLVDNNLNGDAIQQQIPVSANGSGSTATATLSGISFGSVTEGTTSAAMSATLTNTSTTAALTISSMTISGTNAADFAMTTGTGACGASLAANTSCKIYATFKPSLVGPEAATLNVADNATGSPQTAAMSGTGTAAAPTATLTGISFGSVTQGTTSAAMSATLTNTSTTAALTISSITITGTNGDDFSKTTGSNACGSTLAANTSCRIYATFTPSLVGAESATLGVNDNATGSPQTAALTGTGTTPLVPAASLSPTTLAFGNEQVNTTSAAMTTTLSNTGTGPLTINSIYLKEPSEDDGVVKGPRASAITISSSPDYAATTTCGATLAAGATCTISLTFTPSTTGSLPGTLYVSDNASGSPQTASLTGTGYTGGNYTVASPTAPQTVKPGGSAAYTINVSVTPNGDIYNNPVTLTATGLPQGATASFSPVTVTPGTSTATSMMTVRTSTNYALLAPVSGSKWPISSLALMFGGAWALFRRKHRERFGRLLTMMLLLGAMGAATMGLMGCGAGFAQVQPKTYTITVTGTSGEQTQTTTVTLTVE